MVTPGCRAPGLMLLD